MKKHYHTIDKQGKANTKRLAEFLSKNGQLLLPMVDLIEQCQLACDELIDVAGRATIQAVLELSAQQVAGARQQGKQRREDVVWHGQQTGTVQLSDRKLRVKRPRLRRKGAGAGKEVEVPAYEAMQDQPRLGARMLDILLRGVSTRQYQQVIPEMADTVGVSKSSVSRQVVEASEAEVKKLLTRRFDDVRLLVIYVDGMEFGDHVMIGAVGVDDNGNKHVLAIREGATENATVTKELLEELVTRGVDPDQKRLFVIDGSKALRAAINAVFGSRHPIQRCRTHKLRNVMDHLPDEEKDQVRSVMRAAWRMEAKEGMARLRKLADWLERDYPRAAASLLEGLEECFTVNRLDIPPSLHRCLVTTNIIESPQSGVRMRTRRVSRWRDGNMVKRWVASAFLATELSQDHGAPESLGSRCDPQWIEVCHPTGGGVVRWPRPPLPTFNESWDTLFSSIASDNRGSLSSSPSSQARNSISMPKRASFAVQGLSLFLIRDKTLLYHPVCPLEYPARSVIIENKCDRQTRMT